MPADLKNPFGESCCDGGAASDDRLNALHCGCDPRIKYTCHYHAAYKDGYEQGFEAGLQRGRDESRGI